MTLEIKNILEGWANLIKDRFNELEPSVKKVSEERLNICNSCDIRLGSICDPRKMGKHVKTGVFMKGCGCNLPAKTMSTNSKCPLGKW